LIPEYLIIGAGVAGLTAAESLLLRGSSVTVLEKGTAGCESSWAGGGILAPLCPWDYADAVTQLTDMGAALYPQWVSDLYEATGIDPEYEISGMLILPQVDKEQAMQWCERRGVIFELTGEGILLPEVAQVRNPRLIQALRKHVEKRGGNIIEKCEVLDISVEGTRVLSATTSCGVFNADRYIVSAGAWSRQVLGKYALSLDIKPVRGQMLLFKFDAPPLQHILLQDGMYLIPRRDGHLLIGSTLEDVGFDKRTTIQARESLLQRAQLLLPELRGMALLQHWSGLRPASPRNVPVIGRHPELENLYINSGHFRYGVTMAPSSSSILLNELHGDAQPFDVNQYQANWF